MPSPVQAQEGSAALSTDIKKKESEISRLQTELASATARADALKAEKDRDSAVKEKNSSEVQVSILLLAYVFDSHFFFFAG